jgi:two-component system sensor histidine kinase TctE
LPVLVEVAQTTYAHKQLINRLWLHALEQQLLILALVALFILFGLHRGLRPLIRLRDDVRARQEGSLQPLKTNNLPFEIRPLVESFNDYIRRLENYTVSRAHLVQNATHQLRTPLAVLNTQVSDALRASSQQEAQTPLLAARKTLQQTAHLVNQFLALTSAEAHVADKTPLTSQQCCDIVQEVLEDLAALAHKKAIDLGFERSGSDVLVVTDAAALREIAVNVIDNAIRYTPPQGMVTVRVQSGAGKLCLIIEDNGPGVPLDSQEKIFDRFYRLDRTDSHGSGLGLAIVKELASQCGAEVRVIKPSHGGAGFALEVEFKNAKKGYQENLAPL